MAAPNPSPSAFLRHHEVRRTTRRYKVDTACDTCRRKKIKCDGVRPACSHCQKKPHLRGSCNYAGGHGHGDSRPRFLAAPPPPPPPPPVPRPYHPAHVPPPPPPPPPVKQSRSLVLGNGEAPAPVPVPVAGAAVDTGSSTRDVSVSTPQEEPNKPGLPRVAEETEESLNGGHLRDFEGGSVQAFTMRLKAAVDAKLGLPAGESPIFVPTTDAPLFLNPPPLLPSNVSSSQQTQHLTAAEAHVLPPRRQADHLVEIFFRNLHPLWPFLDRPVFSASLDALFAGILPEGDEPVFLSILNAVLSLAMQSQEHIHPPEERQRDSLAFFTRAWQLIRSPAVAWGPPSLERAEAMLLATLYLQCTNQPQDTWATIGHAVRIGQNLGLHLPTDSRTAAACGGGGGGGGGGGAAGRRRRIQLWRMIIFLEKQVSVSLARSPSVSETAIYECIQPSRGGGGGTAATAAASTDNNNDEDEDSPETVTGFLRKTLELYAVTYYHTPPHAVPPDAYRNPFERRWKYIGGRGAEGVGGGGGGAGGCGAGDDEQDHVHMALKLDGHVDKWKQKMPERLRKPDNSSSVSPPNAVSGLLAVLCQIRIAHSRVILLRPMLAHLCLSHQPINTEITSDQSLRQRLIYDSACICVKSAQDIVSTVQRHQSSSSSSNNNNNNDNNNASLFLPWWIRLYYLHVAGTIFITATLQPELSARLSVSESWRGLLQVLEGHKHLSQIIPGYIERLRTLSDEVMQTRWSESPTGAADLSNKVSQAEEQQQQQQQQHHQVLYSDPSLSMGAAAGYGGVDDLFTSGFPFGFDDIFNLPNI